MPGSLEFTVSYVVDYTKRTAMKDQLFTKIVEEVANSDGRLEWASSAVIPMRPPGDAGHESKALLPSSSTLGAGQAADLAHSASPPLGQTEEWGGGHAHTFAKNTNVLGTGGPVEIQTLASGRDSPQDGLKACRVMAAQDYRNVIERRELAVVVVCSQVSGVVLVGLAPSVCAPFKPTISPWSVIALHC